MSTTLTLFMLLACQAAVFAHRGRRSCGQWRFSDWGGCNRDPEDDCPYRERSSSDDLTKRIENLEACLGLVDGGWSDWGEWGACTASCTKSRFRACDNPAPAGCGFPCEGSSEQTTSCSDCGNPVNGSWGQWGSWSSCSAPCGGGIRSRSRACNDPAPANGGLGCVGNSTETAECNNAPCVVNGNWGSWGQWSECTVSCGGGSSSRNRTCDDPAPANGGNPCPGNPTQTRNCNKFPCTCPDRYNYRFNKSCYYVSNTAVSFDDAKANCESDGGKLAEANSQGENEFLKARALSDKSGGNYWFGATDQFTEGTFVFPSSNTPVVFTDWFTNEPVNVNGDEDCAAIDVDTVYDGQWTVEVCTNLNRFICEFE